MKKLSLSVKKSKRDSLQVFRRSIVFCRNMSTSVDDESVRTQDGWGIEDNMVALSFCHLLGLAQKKFLQK